ncbi:hypothetical protein SUNI508_00223 [Seiridium unicorne]|uniref:MYND-type domain-containing protein n=1 Tax=Seiridium unicorne TaxID=138068 RepID=A0ABR2VIT3_9PEZI
MSRIPKKDAAVRTRCNYCEKPGTHVCARCQSARYCSTTCQKKDYRLHDLICIQYRHFTLEARPSPRYVRAILFLAHAALIRFVWVEQTEMIGHAFIDHPTLLGAYAVHRTHTVEIHSGNHNVGHGLLVHSLSAQPIPDAPINRSVMSLGKPGHMRTWFGNQLLIGIKRQLSSLVNGQQIPVCDDVDARDFLHAVDYYRQHPTNPCIIDPGRDPRPSVSGVILFCEASQRRLRQFGVVVSATKVLVPRLAERSVEEAVCPRMAKLGLDWMYRRYSPATERTKEEVNDMNMRNDLALNFAQTMANGNIPTPLLYPGTVVICDNRGAKIRPMHLVEISVFVDSITEELENGSSTQATTGMGQLVESNRRKESQDDLEKFWAVWEKKFQVESEETKIFMVPTKLAPTLDEGIVYSEISNGLREKLKECDEDGA